MNFGKITSGNADATIGLGHMWSNVEFNLQLNRGLLDPCSIWRMPPATGLHRQMYEDGNFGVKGTLGCTGSMNPNGGIVMGSQSSI